MEGTFDPILNAEGSGIMIDEAVDAFFAAIGMAFSPMIEAIRTVFSSAWEAFFSMASPWYRPKPRQDSKQTRAYYRVKARAYHRRKVTIHACPRRYRGNGRT